MRSSRPRETLSRPIATNQAPDFVGSNRRVSISIDPQPLYLITLSALR
jgi:hypothetical protein